MGNKSKIILSAITVSTLLLSGCGGGGGSSTTTTTSSTTVSGVVSGSMYENAKVCFDTNNDGTCTGESTVNSDANGSFNLTANGTVYNIVAELNGATKHEAVGDAGTAVTDNKKFRMPKGLTDSDGKYVVSAISSKIYDKMQENPNLTATQAKTEVATLLGIDENKILENFNDSSKVDASTREKIQTEATKILAVMSENGELNTTTARTAIVGSMTLPSRIDAIKVGE